MQAEITLPRHQAADLQFHERLVEGPCSVAAALCLGTNTTPGTSGLPQWATADWPANRAQPVRALLMCHVPFQARFELLALPFNLKGRSRHQSFACGQCSSIIRRYDWLHAEHHVPCLALQSFDN